MTPVKGDGGRIAYSSSPQTAVRQRTVRWKPKSSMRRSRDQREDPLAPVMPEDRIDFIQLDIDWLPFLMIMGASCAQLRVNRCAQSTAGIQATFVV